MPKSMSEVQSFMDRERLASLATVDPRSEPHVVPVFFTYKDGKVYVQSDRKSVKVRNLSGNRCVAVAVYTGEEAVIIRGKGRVVRGREEFLKRTRDHIYKYRLKLDESGRDSLGIPLFNDKIRCIVEVIGEKTLYW